MKSWRWVLLIFELFLLVLVLVWPQADLPDFTLYGGSAPIVAKSNLSPAPVLVICTTRVQSRLPRHIREVQNQHIRPAVHSTPHSLRSLLCTLLC
jgi:hypothetical protein